MIEPTFNVNPIENDNLYPHWRSQGHSASYQKYPGGHFKIKMTSEMYRNPHYNSIKIRWKGECLHNWSWYGADTMIMLWWTKTPKCTISCLLWQLHAPKITELATLEKIIMMIITCFSFCFRLQNQSYYCQTSNISHTKYLNLNVSWLVLQFFLSNLLKPGVKSRMEI